MIIKINNKINDSAEKIHSMFQSSYTIESEMLKSVNFPPLQRTVSNILISNSEFYAYYKNHHLVGLIEVNNDQDLTHIKSLVVHPEYFRRGIGRKLVQFVLDSYKSIIFIVETGIENHPAVKLYTSLGFKEQNQWDTDHGVRKVRFKRE